MTVYVKTKKELANAIRAKEIEIIICNRPLAENILKFKGAKMPELPKGSPSLGAIGVALAGMEIVYIVAIITLGVVCLYALYKDYDIQGKTPYGDVKMRRNK
jgi:hypothetical protein